LHKKLLKNEKNKNILYIRNVVKPKHYCEEKNARGQ